MFSKELYQQLILDHNKHPKNFHRIQDATHSCNGHNPLCGDELVLDLKIDENHTIQDIAFEGTGCAISKASASIMTEALKGKSVDHAMNVSKDFIDLVTGVLKVEDEKRLTAKLTIFKGVREFSSRVKCAALAWRAMECAIERKKDSTSE
jgi:nitrogen fixation NifU-like protein